MPRRRQLPHLRRPTTDIAEAALQMPLLQLAERHHC
jgi:hypothetical protein